MHQVRRVQPALADGDALRHAARRLPLRRRRDIRLILRHPEAIKRWVATTTIFVQHAQTLSIIGLLRLGWPASAEAVTGTLGFDLVNLGGTRPECFFQAMSGEEKSNLEGMGGSFFVITVARMLLVSAFLVSITLVQMLWKRLARRRTHKSTRGEKENDTLEFIETVVFGMQITMSARASLQMMGSWGSGGWVGQMGGWVALLACALQVLFIAKYGLAVRTLQRKLAAKVVVRGGLHKAPSFLEEGDESAEGTPRGGRGWDAPTPQPPPPPTMAKAKSKVKVTCPPPPSGLLAKAKAKAGGVQAAAVPPVTPAPPQSMRFSVGGRDTDGGGGGEGGGRRSSVAEEGPQRALRRMLREQESARRASMADEKRRESLSGSVSEQQMPPPPQQQQQQQPNRSSCRDRSTSRWEMMRDRATSGALSNSGVLLSNVNVTTATARDRATSGMVCAQRAIRRMQNLAQHSQVLHGESSGSIPGTSRNQVESRAIAMKNSFGSLSGVQALSRQQSAENVAEEGGGGRLGGGVGGGIGGVGSGGTGGDGRGGSSSGGASPAWSACTLCDRLGERWDDLTDALDARYGWSPGSGSLPIDRLKVRLSFLTERYRPETPYWQFVIWLRQVGLIFAASISELADESGGGRDSISKPTLTFAALVAMGVLAVSFALQVRGRPYTIPFQNSLEAGLICCSGLIVLLGLAYALTPSPSTAVEALLLLMLIGSLAVGLGYFVYAHVAEAGGCRAAIAIAMTPSEATVARPEYAEKDLHDAGVGAGAGKHLRTAGHYATAAATRMRAVTRDSDGRCRCSVSVSVRRMSVESRRTSCPGPGPGPGPGGSPEASRRTSTPSCNPCHHHLQRRPRHQRRAAGKEARLGVVAAAARLGRGAEHAQHAQQLWPEHPADEPRQLAHHRRLRAEHREGRGLVVCWSDRAELVCGTERAGVALGSVAR